MDQFNITEWRKLALAESPADNLFEELMGYGKGVHQRGDKTVDIQWWVKPVTWTTYDL